MLELDDFVKSGMKVWEIAIAFNLCFGICATVGIAFWISQITPRRGGGFTLCAPCDSIGTRLSQRSRNVLNLVRFCTGNNNKKGTARLPSLVLRLP